MITFGCPLFSRDPRSTRLTKQESPTSPPHLSLPLPMDQLAHKVGSTVEQYVRSVLEVAAKIPGSSYVGRYIAASHQNDPTRTAFEILLFLFAVRYFLASKQSYSKRDYLKLSDDEVDELIAEWRPEPLIDALTKKDADLLDEVPVLTSANKAIVTIQGDDRQLVNLTLTDLHGVSVDPNVKKLAVEKLRSYGLGSCGPAGFYGNEDIHTNCEKSLARLLGTQSCILYSQGLATAQSVVPCFAKRGDVLVVDDAINMALQRGVQLSRAKVLYFAHNDMTDLERQLAKAVSLHRGRGRLPRRFIITEGLFEVTGNSPDLARIIELKKRFKFRLILDESWSLGILGKTGRGLVEEQGVNRDDVEVTIGSLANGLGIYGGFCAGSSAVVEHQRIVSLAYTFSATEPPYLAGCTSLVADQMAAGEYVDRVASLRSKAKAFTAVLQRASAIDLISRSDSPMVIFRLSTGESADDEDNDATMHTLLHRVVILARKNGLLLARLAQIAEYETFEPVNAIRAYVPNALSMSDVKRAAEIVVKSVKEALKESSRKR